MAMLLNAGAQCGALPNRAGPAPRAANPLRSSFVSGHARFGTSGSAGKRSIRQSAVAFKEAPNKPADHPALKNVNPRLLIGGDFVDSVSGRTFEVLDPRNEQVLANCAWANEEDVDRACKAAREAFNGPWTKMGGKERGRLMYKLADLVEANADELASLESLDNGKPYSVARAGDIPLVASHLRYFAGWADKIHGQTIPTSTLMGNFHVYTLQEPIGVCAQIVPWNFPMLMLAWKIAPSLACGCVSVAKVAEQTPLSALRLGQLALEAGFPPGVLNILTGPGESGAALVAHPEVDKISFTGSTEVGKLVLKSAADTVKNVTMELGGKNPLIIWKDVDIGKAVDDAHMALFYNMGQCCAAGSRVYVHEDIYDEFVDRATKCAQNRVVGDPFDEKTQQGPQVDKDQMEKILHYIKLGQDQGARCTTGGKRIGDKGYFIEPTVFADVGDDMDIANDEIFGPVQTIMKFSDIHDAIRRANKNEYGLAAGVFAKDIDIINTVSRGVKAGTCWVNCWNVYEDSVPFGGYKQSGIGRDKGQAALSNYLQTKAVYQKMHGDPVWM